MSIKNVTDFFIKYISVGLVGNFGSLFFLGSFVFLYLLFTDYYWISLLYLAWIIYDREISEKGSRHSRFRKSIFARYVKKYFPVKLVKTADLDPKRNYLFCCFPHGILCFGGVSAFASDVAGCDKIFPGITTYLLAASSLFWVPFVREVLVYAGVCAASRKSLDYLLSHKGGGKAAALYVGGAQESFFSEPGKYKFLIKSRRGFIRMALKHGSPLVPVISFGENDVFERMLKPDSRLYQFIYNKMNRILGAMLIFPRGKFFCVPYPRPINVVVGRPIEIQKMSDPSEDIVSDIHKKFVDSLTRLFEEEKYKYIKNPEKTFVEII